MSGLAAEVAFFGVLSLFPALLALAAALGFAGHLLGPDVADAAQQQIVDWLTTFLTDRASGTVDAVRHLFDQESGDVLTFALLASVWSASRGTSAVIRAVAVIHEVEDRRSWWRRRAVGLVLLVASVIAIAAALAMFVLGPLLGFGRAAANQFGFGDVYAAAWSLVRYPLALVVIAAWAALVYHLAPDEDRSWRADLPGAVFTAFGWLAASFALRLYVLVAGGGNQVFGVLGGALIVLVWLYLLANALLLGAELNAALALGQGSSGDGDDVEP